MRFLSIAVGVALVGCAGSNVPVSSGNGGEGSGGSTTGGRGGRSTVGGVGGQASTGATPASASSGGSSGGGTGGDVCAGACETLVGTGCAVTSAWQGTCASLCEASPAAISCLQTANTDCNSLALCVFQALCASECPGAGCVPSGVGSCDATFTCNNACSGQPVSCVCGCQSGASPSVAADLLQATACSATSCSSVCSPSGTALSCDNCLNKNCNPAVKACAAN